jgi:hypothetical protein
MYMSTNKKQQISDFEPFEKPWFIILCCHLEDKLIMWCKLQMAKMLFML